MDQAVTGRHHDTATSADRVRQATVTLCEILCVVGTLMGVGVLGTRVAESSGGALAADATTLAPAGPAFSIWSVIYAGLLAYTVAQWTPAWATRERHRTIGGLVAASMTLNALWLLVTQNGWLWVSVAIIVALLLVLVRIVQSLEVHPATTRLDRIVTDGTFGLYLGWVSVAVVANVAATLGASGFRPRGTFEVVLGCLVLLVVAAVGVFMARRLGARWALAAAMCWGLGWIAYGRMVDLPRSVPTALMAAGVGVVVLGGTIRHRRSLHSSEA